MVNLKYVDNPFEQNTFNSINYFAEEKSFYDCINRKFLGDSAFQHLEHTFYMYLLTGDNNEWIGYVLFSNENRVEGYNRFAFSQFLHLLEEAALLSNDSIQSDKLTELKNEIFNSGGSSNFVSILNQAIESVREINNSSNIDDIIYEYYYQLDKYLEVFPRYLYLDIVIALPKEEETKVKKTSSKNESSLSVESKYCGFIRETLDLVASEIKNKFSDIPIFLREDDKNVFVVNPDSLKNNEVLQKSLEKYI